MQCVSFPGHVWMLPGQQERRWVCYKFQESKEVLWSGQWGMLYSWLSYSAMGGHSSMHRGHSALASYLGRLIPAYNHACEPFIMCLDLHLRQGGLEKVCAHVVYIGIVYNNIMQDVCRSSRLVTTQALKTAGVWCSLIALLTFYLMLTLECDRKICMHLLIFGKIHVAWSHT